MWLRKDGKGSVGGLWKKNHSISEKKGNSEVGVKIIIYSRERARW